MRSCTMAPHSQMSFPWSRSAMLNPKNSEKVDHLIETGRICHKSPFTLSSPLAQCAPMHRRFSTASNERPWIRWGTSLDQRQSPYSPRIFQVWLSRSIIVSFSNIPTTRLDRTRNLHYCPLKNAARLQFGCGGYYFSSPQWVVAFFTSM